MYFLLPAFCLSCAPSQQNQRGSWQPQSQKVECERVGLLHAATKTWSNRKKKTKKTNNNLSFKRGKGFKQIFLQKEI